MSEPNINVVRQAILDNQREVAYLLADLMVALGAKKEWSMEDNFHTTEMIAELASNIGLPSAGDMKDEDIAWWRPIAEERGLYYDEDETIGGPLSW